MSFELFEPTGVAGNAVYRPDPQYESEVLKEVHRVSLLKEIGPVIEVNHKQPRVGIRFYYNTDTGKIFAINYKARLEHVSDKEDQDIRKFNGLTPATSTF